MPLHRHLRVFIAAPGDVDPECRIAQRVIDRLNREVSVPLGVSLEIMRGKTHGLPGMARPQSLITPLVDQCNIFIGILWTRFGTPAGAYTAGIQYESGTEEEFNRALTRWEENGAHENAEPRIMMYFSSRATNPAQIDPAQIAKVTAFKEHFGPRGRHPGLFCDYDSHAAFEAAVHQHLLQLAFQHSGGLARSDVISDFVSLTSEEWTALFSSSRFGYFLMMYSRTWRNTYLQHLREIVRRGGEIRVILPVPDIQSPALVMMADRIGERPEALCEKIDEAHKAFLELRKDGFGTVTIKFTKSYLNHALYLFENGGILALYSYRASRVPTPALQMRPGNVYKQCLADFGSLFEDAVERS